MQIYLIQGKNLKSARVVFVCFFFFFFVKQNLTYAGRRFVPCSGIISVGYLTLSRVYFRHSFY